MSLTTKFPPPGAVPTSTSRVNDGVVPAEHVEHIETTKKSTATPQEIFEKSKGGGDVTQSIEAQKLLAKFGLEAEKRPSLAKRFAANVTSFVKGVGERLKEVATYTFDLMRALGLATKHCASMNDISQLKDFAHLAIENGRPLAVFQPLKDVAEFVLKHPGEARKILKFMETAQNDTWKQKSAWHPPDVKAVGDPNVKPTVQKADVVIIGGGLSAGHAVRGFVDAWAAGTTPPKDVLVLEKDTKASREHAASFRNAGIVCTALDFVFDIDEAIGGKPVTRIMDALKITQPEAEQVYQTLMKVMHDATGIIGDFSKKSGKDVGLKANFGLDVVETKEDLDAYRAAAKTARDLGLDWQAVDKAYLKDNFGIESKDIAGAMLLKDSAQLHPGKLVKALFDYAQEQSKNVKVNYETEMISAKENPSGDGWIIQTKRADGSIGEVHAKDVIDAREAFSPYKFREARFSQIHIVDVGAEGKPMQLGETNVCHGLSYMRKISDGKFLCGSGDFPLHDPKKTPAPLASVALYAAAHFKKLFPDTPYNIEKMWGGVFGVNADEIPVAGELLKGWHVVGGSGGSGLNLTPALAAQVVAEINGDANAGPLKGHEHFSPRRFFTLELRDALTSALHSLSALHELPVDKVRIEIGDDSKRSGGAGLQGKVPEKRGDTYVFTVDEKTLDKMNTDAAVLFGANGVDEMKAREQAKSDWVMAQVEVMKRGLSVVTSPPREQAPAPHAQRG